MKTILLILSLCLFAISADATTRNWTGGGGNNKWSTPGNWSPAGTPANGDQLVLNSSGAATVDDMSGLRLLQLVVGVGQTISGTNVLVLTNGIVCGYLGGINEVAVDIQLAASQSFVCQDTLANNCLLLISHPVDLAGHALTLETQQSSAIINFGGIDGRIFGTGEVIVYNSSGTLNLAGNVQFSGCTGSLSIDGTVRVVGKTRLTLKKTCGFSINDRLEIATNAIVNCEFAPQFAPGVEVVVEPGGELDNGAAAGIAQEIANLELRGNAVVDSQAAVFVVRTNLTGYGTNGTPVINGHLILSNSVTINGGSGGSHDLTIAANISGGSFTKIGPGTISLSGTNTFTGTLTILDGDVGALSSTAYGSTGGATILQGGAVRLLGVAIGAEPLTANLGGGDWMYSIGANSWAGPITLNSTLNVISSVGPTTLSGVISGTGDLYVIEGTNVLSGSSANTFTGPISATGPQLQLNKSLNTAISHGPLLIGNGPGPTCEVRWMNTGQLPTLAHVTLYPDGLAALAGFNDTIDSLTFNGGHVNLGSAGNLTLSGSVTVNPTNVTALIDGGTNSGGIFLSAGVTFNVGHATLFTDLQIDSRINGPLGFEKTGAGWMTLDGNNTFTGQAVVQAGTLTVASDNALGSTSGGTLVNGDATLELRSAAVGAEPLTLNSTGNLGHGALWTELGNSSWAGGILLSNDATVRVESGNTLTLSGVISGPGQLMKDGPGTLLLKPSSGNTYTNVTQVNAGILELESASGNSVAGPLIVGVGVARLLASTEIATVPVTVNSGGLLDLNGFSDGIGSLTLNGGGDVTTGAGTLTLGGDLFASAGGTIFSPNIATVSGKLSLGTATRTINVPNNVTASAELILSADISGSAGVGMTKIGTGVMRLDGNNTFTGSLTINTGAVVLASSTAFGSGGGVNVNDNSTLQIDGSLNLNGQPLTLNSTAEASLVSFNGSSVWNGTVALAQDSTIEVGTNASLLISNSISGPGALAKIGPGTLTMGGSTANTYSNLTLINEGTLVLSNSVSPQSHTILGNVVIGDGLGGASADVLRLGRINQISDSAVITVNSSGLFDLNGLTETVAMIGGTGNISLGAGSFFYVTSTNVGTFDGVISGSGAVRKQGTGKLTLNGDNTFVGNLYVDGGTLLVNGSQPQIPATVNGATLGGSGTVGNITVVSGAVSPGNSPGILNCSNLVFNSTSTNVIELNGTTPGTGYDQLNVRGTVALGNAVLKATLGFASAVGNTFTIINNDSTDAVTGTFNGLPQNATLNISGIPFRISYTNGTGNDVVLTQLLPLPQLSVSLAAATNLVLAWPSNYSSLTLESNTNLAVNVWTAVVPPPVINFTNFVVTNAMTDPQRFYRLRLP